MTHSGYVCHLPTPLLASPHFQQCFGGLNGRSLPLDDQDLLRPVETTLLPGTPVELMTQTSEKHIWKMRAEAYPFGEFYVDERFLVRAEERKSPLPPPTEILTTMQAQLGARYIWGGNWPHGIPELLQFYPPAIPLDPLWADTWQLKGFDCSGLLYFATAGHTPRNTSALIEYGEPLSIEGLDVRQIAAQLRPLDLIVWDGHVVIHFDKLHTIESKRGEGVVKKPLLLRLEEIMHTRKPVNHYISTQPSFVVRRWAKDVSC